MSMEKSLIMNEAEIRFACGTIYGRVGESSRLGSRAEIEAHKLACIASISQSLARLVEMKEKK